MKLKALWRRLNKPITTQKRYAPLNITDENPFLGSLEEQEEQIAAIQAAEAKYKEDGDLEALVAFWNRLWSGKGLLFNGSAMHFRAVDLNLEVGNRDQAWSLLTKILFRHPEYDVRVYKYRYKMMKDEKRYMGSLEHLVDRYAVDVGFDREHFIKEAKSTIRKVEAEASEDAEQIAEHLADIGEKTKDIGELHALIKAYFEKIGWLDW